MLDDQCFITNPKRPSLDELKSFVFDNLIYKDLRNQVREVIAKKQSINKKLKKSNGASKSDDGIKLSHTSALVDDKKHSTAEIGFYYDANHSIDYILISDDDTTTHATASKATTFKIEQSKVDHMMPLSSIWTGFIECNVYNMAASASLIRLHHENSKKSPTEEMVEIKKQLETFTEIKMHRRNEDIQLFRFLENKHYAVFRLDSTNDDSQKSFFLFNDKRIETLSNDEIYSLVHGSVHEKTNENMPLFFWEVPGKLKRFIRDIHLVALKKADRKSENVANEFKRRGIDIEIDKDMLIGIIRFQLPATSVHNQLKAEN
jgi:hypothetical protein